MSVAPNRLRRGYTSTRYRRLVSRDSYKRDLKTGKTSRRRFAPKTYVGGVGSITPLSAYPTGPIRNAERQKRIAIFGKIDAEGRPVQTAVVRKRRKRRPRTLRKTVTVTHTPAKVTTLKLRRVRRTPVKRKVYGPVQLKKKRKTGKKVRFGKKRRPKSKKRRVRRKRR